MKLVKTTGGLTQGRGMSEIQCLVWLFSPPACLEINYTMLKFSSVSYSTSDQHKEATQARMENFIGSTTMDVKKDLFLSNKKNKPSFIFLLSRTLKQIGCQVCHARGDYSSNSSAKCIKMQHSACW